MAWNIACSFIFLHKKDIICHFSSWLVKAGRFQLTSILSTTVLLVELMAIKHGRHVSFMLVLATSRGGFPFGLPYASNIILGIQHN